MYICVPCRKEYVCDKNGVGIDFGNGHVYPITNNKKNILIWGENK